MILDDVKGQPAAIETLKRGLTSGKLHHSLLFHGPPGVGKESTAFATACALVCTQRAMVGCGVCQACERVFSQAPEPPHVPLHPDVILVEKGLYSHTVLGTKSDEKNAITVEQIRKVVLERLTVPPHEAKERIVIIRRAEEMNDSAANALLKSLEEPPPHTRFILLTTQPSALLATIRSRCFPLRFAPLNEDLIVELLLRRGVPSHLARDAAQLSSGSMTLALSFADEEQSQGRKLAIEALSMAWQSPLAVLDFSAKQTSSQDGRDSLTRQLHALMASDVNALRQTVLEIEGAHDSHHLVERQNTLLLRIENTRLLIRRLEQNANAPLAFEAHWLTLARNQ